MYKLAIIIPAFKPDFFREALESLANQTDKRFRVYIGDDNSPDDLYSIIKPFESKLDITYRKFGNNIGAKNLVASWSRCVELSEHEDWIWLFSDDDVADHDCVSEFYDLISDYEVNFEVFRFNTAIIDATGKLVEKSFVGPIMETSEEMAYNLLLGNRGNSIVDHIFSRRIYKEKGGFVFTRFGQGADWATSISFTKSGGLRTIPNSIVFWRYSGKNISSLAAQNKSKMMKGYFDFAAWILKHFQYLKSETTALISYEKMRDAAIKNLNRVIIHHYKGLDRSNILGLFLLLVIEFEFTFIKAIKFIILTRKGFQVK